MDLPLTRSVKIAILVMPETTASVVYGMFDLFKSAGRDWQWLVEGVVGDALLEPVTVAADSAAFETGNGVKITPHADFESVEDVDILCIPELAIAPDAPLEPYQQQIDWIRAQYDRGALVAASCSGALLLAASGLLNGGPATTHWAYCPVMAKRFPEIRMQPKRSLVAAGAGQRLIMAGGGTSWMDLSLYLIARFTSTDIAMQVARIYLIDWHDVGQQPFARLAPATRSDDAVILRCQLWVSDNYQQHSPVALPTWFQFLP